MVEAPKGQCLTDEETNQKSQVAISGLAFLIFLSEAFLLFIANLLNSFDGSFYIRQGSLDVSRGIA